MKTHLSKLAALLSVAIFASPAVAEFDYYADSSANEETSFVSVDAEDEEDTNYIEATYSETSFLCDAAQQDDGCKGGCNNACCCVGSVPNMESFSSVQAMFIWIGTEPPPETR